MKNFKNYLAPTPRPHSPTPSSFPPPDRKLPPSLKQKISNRDFFSNTDQKHVFGCVTAVYFL